MRATATAVSGLWEHVCVAPAQRTWGFFLLLRRSALAAVQHDALTVAQAAAYSAMLALFPALIVAAAVVGMLPMALPIRLQLALFFSRVLPSSVLPLLEGYFAVSHRSQTAGALLGSLVVSALGAGNVMATLMEGFRRAHELPARPRSALRRRGRALTLVPLSLVPMAGASALVVFGNLITRSLAAALPATLQSSFTVVALLLRWTVALAGSTGILGVIYHLGTDLGTDLGTEPDTKPSPNLNPGLDPSLGTDPGTDSDAVPGTAPGTAVRKRPEPAVREPWALLRGDWSWRASLPGAALATMLWFLATLLFGYYVTRFANYSRVYGSLGAAVALMIWLYIIALCVLIGSEFNAQLTRPHCDTVRLAHLWRFGPTKVEGRRVE